MSSGGERPAPVVIVAYDRAWPARFDALRQGLEAALGDLALAIEHVGSTSVPGLAAKPIIDIDVVVRDAGDLTKAIARLEAAGYRHEGDLGIAGREAFRAPAGRDEHHLYALVQGADELRRHLAFRDRLCASAEDRRAYARLKRRLARTFRHDREAYADAKSTFVERVLSAGSPSGGDA